MTALATYTKEELEQIDQTLSLLSRVFTALDGIDPTKEHDQITKLIKVKNTPERSNLQTLADVKLQTYLRIGHKIFGEEIACSALLWAEEEAVNVIGYKGFGANNFVDMTKASFGALPQMPMTSINLTSQMQERQRQQKKSFWKRNQEPKEENKE